MGCQALSGVVIVATVHRVTKSVRPAGVLESSNCVVFFVFPFQELGFLPMLRRVGLTVQESGTDFGH